MHHSVRTLTLLVGLLAMPAHSIAASDTRPNLVQRVGPIVIGGGQDAAALRRTLGDGCYVEDEGHLGGRYYTNSKRTFTFHAEFGVDWVLEDIELIQGLEVPDTCTSSKTLVSKRLDKPIVVQHGVRLGMSAAELIQALGTPVSDRTTEGVRVLLFEAAYDTDDRVALFYEARYAFKADRLFFISLHDGE